MSNLPGPQKQGAPQLLERATEAPPWIVTVYNNDTNTYEEVITVLMHATGCTEEEAYIEAWEVDHYGQSVVHRATEGECQDVASIIAVIGIRVEATPDPVFG